MLRLLAQLWSHRQLVRGFVVRDLKARYVGSSMGFFWSVVVPFLYLFVFMVVFSLILKARWEDGAEPEETALIMLVGILSWQAFAETLSRATNCLVDNANLIQKVVFPSEILPAYLTVSSLVNMLIGLPIVVVGAAYYTDRLPGISYLALPVLLVLQAIFTFGLGYFLSTLNLFLRDTYHLIGVLTMVWMFATPIFYPARLVQDTKIPMPGTATEIEAWVKQEGPRARVPANWTATFEVDEPEDLNPRFTIPGLETLPPDQQEFFQQRAADQGPVMQSGLRRDPPEGLNAYARVGSELLTRQMVVERETFSLGILLELNPMYWLIECYRAVILYGRWPDPRFLGQFAAVALVVLALGSRFFSKHQHRFPDLL